VTSEHLDQGLRGPRGQAVTALPQPHRAAPCDFPVFVRPLVEADLPLVYKSWIGVAWEQQCWQTKRIGLGVGRDDFSAGIHARIDRLVERGRGLVACPLMPDSAGDLRADPGTICGYLVGEGEPLPVLHMVYVRDDYRTKAGRPWHVATSLLRAAFPSWPEGRIWYSQHTAAMRHLALKWNATFNPFLAE